MVRRVLVSLTLAAASVGGLVLAASPASASSKTIHASGLTPYLIIGANAVHGHLTKFRAYYVDGYVHGSRIPDNVHLTAMEHYTCLNPELVGKNQCGVQPAPKNDIALNTDPEDPGHLGQNPTGFHNNVTIDFDTVGTGHTLQWRTYEHGAHTEFSLNFADGFELYVVLDHPNHILDIKFVRPSAGSSAVSVGTDTW